MKQKETHTYARAKSAIALAVVACIVATQAWGPTATIPTVEAASSFRPTIFVNTEAFLNIDDDDTSANVVLRFGDTLAKTLTFNRSLDRFEFNDDVYVAGTIQASNTLSGAIVHAQSQLRASGSLVVDGAAIVNNSTISLYRNASPSLTLSADGTSANIQSFSQPIALNPSGNNVGVGKVDARTKLDVAGAISGSFVYATRSFSGAGLSDCDTAGTSKLLWDATTGRFSCGTDTDTNTTYTAGQGLNLNGANAFALNATVTGSVIRGINSVNSSGSLVWEGKGSGASLHIKNYLSVGARQSGSLLTVGRVGSGSLNGTSSAATLFSTDQMALGQLEGGAYFGRVGLKENQWGLSNYGNSWAPKESNRNWKTIAMSSDGKVQTAAGSSTNLYVSYDYGQTWAAKDSARGWINIAMSSDGKMQTAIVTSGQIYTSSDYGNTWSAKDSNRGWIDIAMSSDGKVQNAVVNNGQIYVSYDYGNTWTAKESTRNWTSIAMSSDGKVQTATVFSGKIYTSFDYGNTWTAKDSNRSWEGVTMSSDGKMQTAIVYGGQIYVSSDYGSSWTAKDSSRNWYVVVMSSDGRVQTAVVLSG